jgi:hypothetical protein
MSYDLGERASNGRCVSCNHCVVDGWLCGECAVDSEFVRMRGDERRSSFAAAARQAQFRASRAAAHEQMMYLIGVPDADVESADGTISKHGWSDTPRAARRRLLAFTKRMGLVPFMY